MLLLIYCENAWSYRVLISTKKTLKGQLVYTEKHICNFKLFNATFTGMKTEKQKLD